jgi:hypothetical protein
MSGLVGWLAGGRLAGRQAEKNAFVMLARKKNLNGNS